MKMDMKRTTGRWTVLTKLLLAVGMVGLAGAGLYAYVLVSKSGEKRPVSADSCPSPIADLSKKERKTMTTAVQKSMIPLIDRALPAKTETATFGLG